MKKNLSNALEKLEKLLPCDEFSRAEKARAEHAGDKWFASRLPDAVVSAQSTNTVATLLRFAQQHKVPVTPRGAGYGYVGGCVPVKGGVSLSLARMNRIIEINAADFVAVVQPGVITKTLQDAAERKRLYYPPDPASRADCSLGGNIATNAGGPRCLKYGVTRDYVLGLEVVLPDGSVARVGSRTHKNKTGFDFTRFFVGSEGMLGVVTEATLKLLPLPPYRACLAVGFDSMRGATRTIREIFRAGFLPCALEVADDFTLTAARRRTGSKRLEGCHALIIVELDGQERSVTWEIRDLEKLVRKATPVFVQRALGGEQTELLWQLRREFSFSLRDTGLIKLNEDIVVPRGRLEDLFRFTTALQKKHGIALACFGHAGDGNIHCNVMYDAALPNIVERSERVLDELFAQILDWGGVITGEHGIGLAKKRWWPAATSPEVRQLHRAVKRALDPRDILNPGKFVE